MHKPVNLYRWIYREFDIQPGTKVLDTHLGSGTHRIAAYERDIDFVGCEIVKKYFDDQEDVFQEYTSQLRMEETI